MRRTYDGVTPALPLLVACAHGTRDPAGQQAVAELVEAVRREAARRGGPEVRAAYVDIQPPTPDVVLAAASGPAVLVPLLLSTGYHVEIDLARAARRAPAPTALARPLGPDPLLVEPLVESLVEAARGLTWSAAGAPDVRLVAAGSSRAGGTTDVEAMAALLTAELEWLGRPVRPAYLAASDPLLPEVVAANGGADRPTVAISYLLAPGHFQRRLDAAGAESVTPPLLRPGVAPPAALVELVLRRYDQAAASLPPRPDPAGTRRTHPVPTTHLEYAR